MVSTTTKLLDKLRYQLFQHPARKQHRFTHCTVQICGNQHIPLNYKKKKYNFRVRATLLLGPLHTSVSP